MTKYIVFLLVIFLTINTKAQFNHDWVSSYAGATPYGGEDLKKAILISDTVFVLNKNTDSLKLISIRTKKIKSVFLSRNKNLIGMPFDIDGLNYFNLEVYWSNLFKGAGMRYNYLSDKLKFGDFNNLIPLSNFCNDLRHNKRNYLLNINNGNRLSPDYMGLLFVDFFIRDNILNLFIRDNYRLTWWQYKGVFNEKEDKSRWKEVKTYTYMDSTSILFQGKKSKFDFQNNYKFNALKNPYSYYYSGYSFFMTLFSFAKEREKESILKHAFKYYAPEYKETHKFMYQYIKRVLPDSVINKLHAFTAIPLSVPLWFKEKHFYNSFPTHLKDTILKLIDTYKEPIFFNEAFNVIQQDDKFYLINRAHRIIYLLDDNKIISLGKIGYKHSIMGVDLYIEDRDNEQLIVFGEIDWFEGVKDKPKVREILDESEIREFFGNTSISVE